MSFIDSHVHIDFYDDFEKTIKLYETNKIYTIFVTNLPEIYQSHKKIFDFKHNKYIKLALGYHPEMVGSYSFNSKLFSELIDDTDYIGEVGLNKTSCTTNLPEQIKIFSSICEMIGTKPKILSIHSKGCENEIFEILSKYKIKFPILHWYSGKISFISKLLDIGCYFSVNPSMLTSIKGKTILNQLPTDRILFETDGPFVKYNKRIVCPDMFQNIYSDFSSFYKIGQFDDLVFNNFKKLIFAKYNQKLCEKYL